VDASSIEIDVILAYIGEGEIYNTSDFTSRKLSTTKNNYMKTKREGLEMVYSLHKDKKEYCKSCKYFQRVGRRSRRDEMPQNPQFTLNAFDKWEVDFVRPINTPRHRTRAKYIITMMDYLTRWEEAELVTYCNMETLTRLLYKNIVTRFGCPKVLTSDQGTHFLNKIIVA
jgi:hypothetical protein